MDKKETIGLLKQENIKLDEQRHGLIAQLENAEGHENIKPIVDSLHTNRKLVTENLEAIKDAEAD
jgi:Fe2+ or Zn2+ uptake regulation protein